MVDVQYGRVVFSCDSMAEVAVLVEGQPRGKRFTINLGTRHQVAWKPWEREPIMQPCTTPGMPPSGDTVAFTHDGKFVTAWVYADAWQNRPDYRYRLVELADNKVVKVRWASDGCGTIWEQVLRMSADYPRDSEHDDPIARSYAAGGEAICDGLVFQCRDKVTTVWRNCDDIRAPYGQVPSMLQH